MIFRPDSPLPPSRLAPSCPRGSADQLSDQGMGKRARLAQHWDSCTHSFPFSPSSTSSETSGTVSHRLADFAAQEDFSCSAISLCLETGSHCLSPASSHLAPGPSHPLLLSTPSVSHLPPSFSLWIGGLSFPFPLPKSAALPGSSPSSLTSLTASPSLLFHSLSPIFLLPLDISPHLSPLIFLFFSLSIRLSHSFPLHPMYFPFFISSFQG